MRFVVDCMLGKLAKWLKILGFDTVFFNRIEDEDLVAVARKEGRVLLTKDTGIISRYRDVKTLFIESEDWEDQVRQVLDELDIRQAVRPHTRCLSCNGLLKELPQSRARNLVTPFVFEHADSFALCPECGRVYWRGTHMKDMELKLTKILSPKS